MTAFPSPTRLLPGALLLALPLVALPAVATPHVTASPSVVDAPETTMLARRGGKRGGKHHEKMTPEAREKMRAAIAAKIDDYVRTTVATDVGLTDDKAQQLADLFKAAAAGRHEKRKATRDAMQTLRDLVAQNASDAELSAQMKTVRTLRAQKHNDEGLFDDAAKFLTTQERARLMIALPQMRKDMRHMMHDAKGKGRKGKGRRGGGGEERGGFGGPDDSQ